MLRDRSICGIWQENTQVYLLPEANLTLRKAIKVTCDIEAAEAQTSQLLQAMHQLWQLNIRSKAMECSHRHHLINVGSALIVREATIKLKIVIIEMLNGIRKYHKTGHLLSACS